MLYLLYQSPGGASPLHPRPQPAALPDLPGRHGGGHGAAGRGRHGLALHPLDAGQAGQGPADPRPTAFERHITEKAGTPTMGGLMFLAGITVATLLWADLGNVYVWVVLMVTLAFGGLGFLDDYAKVTKQTTAGVSGRLRLAVEAGRGHRGRLPHGQVRPRRRRKAPACPPPWPSRSSRTRCSISAGSTWPSAPS